MSAETEGMGRRGPWDVLYDGAQTPSQLTCRNGVFVDRLTFFSILWAWLAFVGTDAFLEMGFFTTSDQSIFFGLLLPGVFMRLPTFGVLIFSFFNDFGVSALPALLETNLYMLN